MPLLEAIMLVVGLVILAIIYFAPTLIAVLRGVRAPGAVIAINIFLGWTLLGWIAALVWSLGGSTHKGAEQDAERLAKAIFRVRDESQAGQIGLAAVEQQLVPPAPERSVPSFDRRRVAFGLIVCIIGLFLLAHAGNGPVPVALPAHLHAATVPVP
jgi:hypothetical protein